ncbi:nb-arc domain-containing protein [Fusarium denticulatum]|uniref:Nb-arc domain-containing protein n=1 Tax=Fusarium denticulatum TaxID=48507 RepID=A0A8H5WWX0_9HYPO|nr:nb-arc domain-containing protein [Fusarium denticulatum]
MSSQTALTVEKPQPGSEKVHEALPSEPNVDSKVSEKTQGDKTPASANQDVQSKPSKTQQIIAGLIKIRPQDEGLKTYYTPPQGQDTNIDIVAVHGLGVNPIDTWNHHASKRNWLSDKDMLPSELPDARIMSYCYNSQWIGDNAVKSSLEGVAAKLLRSLGHERKKCPERPVIFIGHCLGGLVMQQEAYLSLHLQPEDWSNLSTDNVNGMVFLGTPHHGVADGVLSTQGQIYQSILASKLHVEPNILGSVERNSDVLKSVVHNFTRRIHNIARSPEIFCFYEQRITNVGAIVGLKAPAFLVDETSGTLSGHQKEELPLDHFSMNKFENEQDNNYQSVSREVVRMAQKSMEMSIRVSSAGAKPDRGHLIPTLPAPIATEDRFAPRGGLLDKIAQKFESSGRVALYGPAGTGKSHVAVEYAYRYRREYPASHILWVNAGSAEEFECSYKRIAEDRRLVRDGMDMSMVLETVWKFLRYESSGHWLMILDGLEDEALLQATSAQHTGRSLLGFIPNSVHSSVLITTQSKSLSLRQVGKLSDNSTEMPKLNEKDASILMIGRITKDTDRNRWIKEIGKAVDNLPIGFVLLQIYQKEVRLSMKPQEVLKAVKTQAEERRPTARAWNLLLDLMKKEYPESVDLMLMMGAIDLQSVPGTLMDRAQISKQIPILVRYGIVEPSTDKRVYHITSAIRVCVRDWLAKHPDQKVAIEELALSVMCERLTPETSEGLLSCALALLKCEAHSSVMRENMLKLHRAVYVHYNGLKQRSRALAHLQKCIKILEADPTIKNRENIMTQTKKDVEYVKKALKRESQMMTQEPGARSFAATQADVDKLSTGNDHVEDHEETIGRVSELAGMQLAQSQKKGSNNTVDLYKRILNWHQSKRKADHIGTARHQYNLALAYDSKGEFDKAEKLYHCALTDGLKENTREALVLRFRILGNLVCSYGRQGRLEDTQEVLQTLLPEQMEILGWDHPDTLVTRHSAALLLQEHGSIDVAGKELHRILDGQRSLLDPDDPALLRTACSLALNLRLQGQPLKAKKLFQETLKTQKQLLGKDHVDTVKTNLMLKELLSADAKLTDGS